MRVSEQYIIMQGHAVDTYDEFVEANKEKLQNLPPPLVALKYYKGGDLYYFDMLQTKGGSPRRPECRYTLKFPKTTFSNCKAESVSWLPFT